MDHCYSTDLKVRKEPSAFKILAPQRSSPLILLPGVEDLRNARPGHDSGGVNKGEAGLDSRWDFRS